jgi:putative NADH-flavin reductase
MAEVVVFGAGGRLGRRVAAEASSRGHRVIGVVHGVASVPVGEDAEVVTGDVTDLGAVHRLAESADVLVATVGGAHKSLYLRAAHALVAAAESLGDRAPRIIHSGGGGSLLDADGTRFVDKPGFPEALRPEVLGQAAALDY